MRIAANWGCQSSVGRQGWETVDSRLADGFLACRVCLSRDRTDPKAWYVPKGLMDIPPEGELEKSTVENVKVGVFTCRVVVWL